jgi:crotonobetaine/carnitine-CoA ligase
MEAPMVPLDQRTVVHVLRGGAERHPDRIAVRDAHEQLDYVRLLDRSARAGAALAALGVGSGDRVLIMLDNNVEHVLTWFGASCIAAVEVPVNTASMGPQLAFIANDCEARVLVIEAAYLPRLREVAGELMHLRHLVVRGDTTQAADLPFEVHPVSVLRDAEPGEVAALAPRDISGIMYTSGTTGTPKGVVVTHAQTYGRNGPLGPGSPQLGDTCLVTLPIYHVIGQCRGLYNALIAGGTTVLEDRFSASRFWDICREHGVTYVPLVGVMASYLLAQPPRDDDHDNPVQRIALGTTIPEVERFRERFGVPELYVSYGLTEAGGVLVGPAEADGCGSLREDFEARLVDEHDVPVGPGEVGELVLRPTEPWTTMVGYYKRPEETLARWRNLWLHTGDLMRRRDDGVYLFVGRLAERIRFRGENVSPAAVEAQIAAHPSVAECAVVGVDPSEPGAAAGDRDILAALVPAPGSTIDHVAMVDFLSTRLPYFSVPRFFRVIDALPRTDSTHRVQRGILAQAGVTGAWDRVAAGVRVGRDGSVSQSTNAAAPDPSDDPTPPGHERPDEGRQR